MSVYRHSTPDTLPLTFKMVVLWCFTGGVSKGEQVVIPLVCPAEHCQCPSPLLGGLDPIHFHCTLNSTNVRLMYNPRESMLHPLEKDALNSHLLHSFSGLQSLNLTGLGLTDLPHNLFEDLTNLKMVILQNNYLKHLPASLWKHNPNLWSINVDNNQLEELYLDSLTEPTSLKRIFSNGNHIKLTDEIFSNFTKLEWLHLGRNGIKQLPARLLHRLRELQEFDVRSNEITEIPDNFFVNSLYLQEVYLNNNLLRSLPTTFSVGLFSLRELHLDNNKLERITNDAFQQLVRVRLLFLSNNRITVIEQHALEPLKNLERLDLSHNKLQFKDDVPALRQGIFWLDLSHNNITTLEDKTWRQYPCLADLDLSHNHLEFLRVSWLSFMYSCNKNKSAIRRYNKYKNRTATYTEIKLQNNKISTIDVHHTASPSGSNNFGLPTTILIGNNPINCNCKSLSLVMFLQAQHNDNFTAPFILVDDQLLCKQPVSVENERVSTIHTTLINCTNEQCPSGCQCTTRSRELGIRVQCQNAKLAEIPSIPHYNVNILDLSNNRLVNATGIKYWYTLTSLYLADSLRASGIKHLTTDFLPVNNLTVLKELVLSHNDVESIDPNLFQGMVSLVLLDLSYNKLRTLLNSTFLNLKDLKILYLHHNSLTLLTDNLFEHNLKLTILKLGYNNLTTTRNVLQKTCQLRELGLEHNSLIKPFLSACLPNAEIILLSHNHISSLTPIIDCAPKLRKLDLSYNNLTVLNISELNVLEGGTNINLQHNNISHFFYPLNVSTGLENSSSPLLIQLNSNPAWCDCNMQEFIQYLKNRYLNTHSPQIEFAVDNLICKGPPRMEGQKVQMLAVDELTCRNEECPSSCKKCFTSSSNNYYILECMEMPDSAPFNVQHLTLTGGTFKSLDKLVLPQWANLTDLKISCVTDSATSMQPSIFKRLTYLKTLSLIRSSVFNTDRNWLHGLRFLSNLDLSYNQINLLSSDTFVGTVEIEKLNLSHNSISELPDMLLRNMECLYILDLSHNQIQTLTTEFMRMGTHLVELYMSDNYITNIEYNALTICKKLLVLDLSKNNLGLSEVERLPTKIQKLDLSQNVLDNISVNWFALGNLQTIDLSFTKLRTVKLDDLVKFPVDSTVYLRNTSISRVVWFSVSSIYQKARILPTNIVLDNNSISCDCHIVPLVHHLRQENFNNSIPIKIQASNLQCSTPETLRGKPVALLKERDLYCKFETCPHACECYFEAGGKNNVVNCSKSVYGTLNLNYLYVAQILILNNISLNSLQELSDLRWDKLTSLTFHSANTTTRNTTMLADILRNKTNLEYLDISHNYIQVLPQNAFTNNYKLHALDVSSNQLAIILDTTFDNLLQLQCLDLSGNHLERLPMSSFLKLAQLRELNLAHNHIAFFSQDFLPPNSHLHLLNLSYNSLGSLLSNVSLVKLTMLKNLDWSHNFIRLPQNLTLIIPVSLTSLNVSHNKLTNIGFQNWTKFSNLKLLDLSDNAIESLNMTYLIFGNNSNTTVSLNRNYALFQYSFNISENFISNENGWKQHLFLMLDETNISCECQLRSFIKETELVYGNISVFITVNQPKACIDQTKQVYCSITKSCVPGCFCYNHWNNTNILVMNCTRGNLTQLPTTSPKKVNQLIADYNRIKELYGLADEMWGHVTHLSFRFNLLTALGQWYPKTLQSIHLDNNLLARPSGWLLAMVQNSSMTFNLTLGKNPWLCQCEPQTIDFQTWLLHNNKIIPDIKDVRCNVTGDNLLSVQPCQKKWWQIIAPLMGLTFILMTTLLAIILYFRYKTEVRMCLYAHGMCVSEDLLDEDKEYDAFISYSSEDSDFVFEQIVPGLENSAPFYKLCIHERDWLAGLQILDQIALSVENSRRTLVVLSLNYLQSMWSGLEFQAAYHQSLKDQINRILIVVLGELPPKDTLDPNLRLHINLNTYLKADDPRFLDKLRYAMPHKQKIKENQQTQNETLELTDNKQ